jgi:adenosylmethionine-8-amino-7-oxononanoate aminotransferase
MTRLIADAPAGISHVYLVSGGSEVIEAKIEELGPQSVMAFVAETVVGATAGAVPPIGDYFRRVREICNRHGVLLILDEVMCGMGRTGRA